MSKLGGSISISSARIEVFVAVVETRHMTRAADMLGMTQSAVSQRLKNLEMALGAQLFERGQRPIALTKAGIALHRRGGLAILARSMGCARKSGASNRRRCRYCGLPCFPRSLRR